MKKSIEFKAVIVRREEMNAAYVEFPFDTNELFGIKGRVPIIAYFDKIEYRGSLVRMKTPGHILGLTQDVRKKLGKGPGDSVHVKVIQDSSKRRVEIPPDIKNMLSNHQEEHAYFEKLAYTHQKEYVNWISSAKKPETQARRLKKMLQMLTEKIKHP